MNLIFKLSEGSTLANVEHELPSLRSTDAQRLYDIADEVHRFRQARRTTRYQDDQALFELEVLPTLDLEAQNLYRTYILRDLASGDAARLIEELSESMHVDYVQPDEENVLHTAPNDPDYTRQWGMQRTQCESAWARSMGEDVVVAVVDTGVDYGNADIAANMWRNSAGQHGYDFSNNTPNPKDVDGHGSHVAGIIAAVANNGLQVAGVAPKARIMAVKVFPNAIDSRCASGIKYAVDNGARVINNSWGPGKRRPTNPVIEDAVGYAHARGVIVVFSAGNDNDDVQYYAPANSPRAISVAATTSNDQRASYSNHGAVTIAAPGSDILSLKPNASTPTMKSGTSMAAPFVTGAVALYIRLNPKAATFDSIRRNLQATADAITVDKPIGKRLNIGKFVVKVPDATMQVQEPVSHSYKGVTGCRERKEEEAMVALRNWRGKLPQRYPGYVVVSATHLGGTASTRSGIDYWTQERWCKTTINITCWAELRAAGAIEGVEETEVAVVSADAVT